MIYEIQIKVMDLLAKQHGCDASARYDRVLLDQLANYLVLNRGCERIEFFGENGPDCFGLHPAMCCIIHAAFLALRQSSTAWSTASFSVAPWPKYCAPPSGQTIATNDRQSGGEGRGG